MFSLLIAIIALVYTTVGLLLHTGSDTGLSVVDWPYIADLLRTLGRSHTAGRRGPGNQRESNVHLVVLS